MCRQCNVIAVVTITRFVAGRAYEIRESITTDDLRVRPLGECVKRQAIAAFDELQTEIQLGIAKPHERMSH